MTKTFLSDIRASASGDQSLRTDTPGRLCRPSNDVATGGANGLAGVMSEPIERLPMIRVLSQFGYSVEWHRTAGEARCVVSSQGESWEGIGVDDTAALDDAIAQLAPSRISRTLLDQASSRGAADASPFDPNGPMRDLRAILADLELVSARVEAGIPEAALMAPMLQKLHVLAWIARGRTLEHEARRHRAACDATGSIARRLTALCKTWWPGSVRALQLDATPERATREQGLPPAFSWLEVAEMAELRLEQIISELPSDDGWRDTIALEPPPQFAGREIAAAIAVIERLFGSVDMPPGGPIPALGMREELELEEAAARLRWSRLVTPDPERWGAAIGRLRWLVAQNRGGARLARLLDPTFCPRPSWEAHVQATRSRLIALAPPPDEPGALLDWLTTVFDAVDGPTLAVRLSETRTKNGAPVAPLVLALQEADLPAHERRLRRRLRHLQSLLQEAEDGPVARTDSSAPAHDAVRFESDIVPRLTHDEMIFAKIRDQLPSVHALFVSNREDPMLRERLEKALGWQIEWTTAEPRRIASITNAMSRGKYRVVLSATGFQDHATDISLARAAASSNTLYVRVNRGRATACARALARELGIRIDSIELDEPEALENYG